MMVCCFCWVMLRRLAFALFLVLAGSLFASAGVAGAAQPTALCSEAKAECSESGLYADGAKLSAVSTNLVIETSLGKLACESSKLEGSTIADYGYSLPIEVSSLAFTNCKLGTLSCTMTASDLPYTGWMEKGSGGGTFDLVEGGSGSPTVNAKCSTLSCSFAGEPSLTVTTSGTSSLVATKVPLVGSGGGACPAEAFLSGVFVLHGAGGANVLPVELTTPPVTLTPANPPVKPPLVIVQGAPQAITVKSERPYVESVLVNGPVGPFNQMTTCGANIAGFGSCVDTLSVIPGTAKGKPGMLKVTVDKAVEPGDPRTTAYRLKVG
jgi:hypothetical protein